MIRGCGYSVVTLLAVAGGLAVASDPVVQFSDRERRIIDRMSPLPPPRTDATNPIGDEPAAARLGQTLFFDARLSRNGEVSCATCHDPEQAFADGRTVAEGLGTLDRHTPTLWNVAYNRWFFWDGRADTLWSQALQPLENPLEHGASRLQCAHVVYGDPGLRSAYERVFGPMPALDDAARFPAEGRPAPAGADARDRAHGQAWASMRDDDRDAVNRVFANIGKAIAAYERRLVSRRAPFDVFVEGLGDGDATKLGALSAASAQRGLKLFIGKANCRMCHFGATFTDGEFHSTGIPPLGGPPLHDAGRYEGVKKLQASDFNAAGAYAEPSPPDVAKVSSIVTSSETWGQFKTPSLRNVGVTAPYMHQGQLATLEDVIVHYSTLENVVLPSHHREQVLQPLNLTADEIADLAAFLRSLTDENIPPALKKRG